jgi:hypothetical protein
MTEEKEFTVEEKLEILNQQIGFMLQALAELDAQVASMGNFLQMVFSLSAPKPEEEEAPADDQSQS